MARASPVPEAYRSVSRSPRPSPRLQERPRRVCKNPSCGYDEFTSENGQTICQNCGLVLEEDGNYRAEAEFDETAAGAATLRGTQVGFNQTHQRTYISRVDKNNNAGREAAKAAEKTLVVAKECIRRYCATLSINDPEFNTAVWFFQQAYRQAFYKGRTIRQVAVCCLYLSIRRRSVQQPYPLMLIDFAEIDGLNVFELGKMTKDLQNILHLDTARQEWLSLQNRKEGASAEEVDRLTRAQENISVEQRLHLLDPEVLIEKFCKRLDFADLEQRVAADALRIAKSMNRDWITTGRRPSGVAGAAVIIAARMNNFRRTQREVVLVAKVTETTLGKRLEEFKETKSSQLSLEAFRETSVGAIQGPDIQNPPSYYRALPEWQARQKKRKRSKANTGALTAAELENNDEVLEGDSEETLTEPPRKQPRVDAEGFTIPDIPTRPQQPGIDSADLSRLSQPPQRQPRSSRSRTPGTRPRRPPEPPSAEELAAEASITEDIRDQLRRNASLDPTGEALHLDEPPGEAIPGTGVADIYPAPSVDFPSGPPVDTSVGDSNSIPMTPELAEDEFESDDDVANCLLNDFERRIKETIWVTENAEWLRSQHQKKIRQELKDQEMREKGLDPEKEKLKAKRRKDGMKKSGRVGDVSYLDGTRKRKSGPRADETPEEAEQRRLRETSERAQHSVQMMFKQRGTFSRRVDYDNLSKAYALPGFEDSSSDTSRDASADHARSRSASAASAASSDHFFRPLVSRGAVTSNIRRAKARPHVRMGASATAAETDAETEIDEAPDGETEHEEEVEAEEILRPESTRQRARRSQRPLLRGHLPTPTQTQQSLAPDASDADGESGADSPLSSTHTPIGYGSAGLTPPPSNGHPLSQVQNATDSKTDEPEGDADDYYEEDNEDDDDDEDDDGDGEDPDKYFAEQFDPNALEEEEVVEDE